MNLRRAIDPRNGRAHGRFAFADDERQAVDEQDEIGPTRLAGPIGVLRGDDEVIAPDRVEVDQPHGGVLIVRAEGHGALAAQPRGEFFVGAHEAVAGDREQNGAQAIQHFVGAIGLLRDFGIERDQRLAHLRFHQHVAFGARKLFAGDVLPADVGRGLRHVFAAIRRAGFAHRPRRLTTQQIADEVFDGVGFVEHTSPLTPLFAKKSGS